MAATVPLETPVYPLQPLEHLDALWVQVAGTVCNLTCAHCFVSAGPDNQRQRLMSRGQVASRVSEAALLGVREFYFTGGEPFFHPEILEILADALPHGACTVLTNGTPFTAARSPLLTLDGDVSVDLVRVPYDHEPLAREMEAEALPREFVETIRTGWWTTCLENLPAKERARGIH